MSSGLRLPSGRRSNMPVESADAFAEPTTQAAQSKVNDPMGNGDSHLADRASDTSASSDTRDGSHRRAAAQAVPKPSNGLSLRDRAIFLVKLAASCLILWAVTRSMDFPAVIGSVSRASWALVAAGFASSVLSIVIAGARWWMVLRALGQRCGLAPAVSLFWIGNFLSQVLPSTAADALRVWLTVQRGYELRSTVHSVIFERLLMLLILVFWVAAVQPFVARRFSIPVFDWLPIIVAACGAAGVAGLLVAHRFTARWRNWRIVRDVATLSTDTWRLVRSKWATPLLLLTFVAHFNLVASAGLIGLGLGLQVSIVDYFLFIPFVVVATILPISVSGWGVREALLIAMLGRLGVPDHDALTFSVLIGFLAAIASLPGLALWWMNGNVRSGRL